MAQGAVEAIRRKVSNHEGGVKRSIVEHGRGFRKRLVEFLDGNIQRVEHSVAHECRAAGRWTDIDALAPKILYRADGRSAANDHIHRIGIKHRYAAQMVVPLSIQFTHERQIGDIGEQKSDVRISRLQGRGVIDAAISFDEVDIHVGKRAGESSRQPAAERRNLRGDEPDRQ